VIQLSPPLVVGPEEFDRIVEILADVLEEAWQELGRRNAALFSAKA
jgi:adenosylmethionine-8-amino-7-oxononanoate aminotransferase